MYKNGIMKFPYTLMETNVSSLWLMCVVWSQALLALAESQNAHPRSLTLVDLSGLSLLLKLSLFYLSHLNSLSL